MAADGDVMANLKPVALNGVDASGTAMVEVSGTRIHVTMAAMGLLPDTPHAAHIHFAAAARHECPSAGDDTNKDGHLNTTEGGPAYGDIVVSLTKTGDTSPKSGLAVDRFDTAEGGKISYERGSIEVSPAVADAIAKGQSVVVVHGVDHNHDGKYDGDKKSDLDPRLPTEATDPALCGALRVAPTGGMATGDGGAPAPGPTRSGTGAGAAGAAAPRTPRPGSGRAGRAVNLGPIMRGRHSADIPSIGVHTSTFVDLGRAADGSIEVRRGRGVLHPRPHPGPVRPGGDRGHVDSHQGPPFFYAGALKSGARISVGRKDGSTATFVVDQVASYSKARFPTTEVYGTHQSRGAAADHLRRVVRPPQRALRGQRRRVRSPGVGGLTEGMPRTGPPTALRRVGGPGALVVLVDGDRFPPGRSPQGSRPLRWSQATVAVDAGVAPAWPSSARTSASR